MEYGSWVPFLTGGIVTMLVIWHANRESDNVTQCKAGRHVQLIYLIGALMFSAICITLFIPDFYQAGLNDGFWLKPCFILLSLLFSWLFVDSLVRELRWDADGVKVRRLVPKLDQRYSWQDIDDVKYLHVIQNWRIDFADGKKFSISEIMRGSQAFINAFEERKGQ